MAGFTPMDAGYVLVSERHAQFVKDYPFGVIETTLAKFVFDPATAKGFVVTQTRVWKDRKDSHERNPPDATELASMPIPGVTSFTRNSEAENCATSSLGRALAMLGYHAKESMASSDEIAMKKVSIVETAGPVAGDTPDTRSATPAQKAKVMAWGKKLLGDEKAVRAFVKREVGVYKSADLTRSHIDTLFVAFKILEASGGELDGVSDE